MLATTDAVVLALQPHSDKAHVLHAYTRAYGRVNYMVYGLGRKHAAGLYTPFSLIRITANQPSGLSVKPPTLKEATPLSFSTGGINPLYKQTVALFLSEVLYHTLRHPMPDEPMFDFIASAIPLLNATDEPQNFHLSFLIGFAAQLGFSIDSASDLLTEPHTRTERQTQLRRLCGYFAEHVDTWQPPRSLEILTEIFD